MEKKQLKYKDFIIDGTEFTPELDVLHTKILETEIKIKEQSQIITQLQDMLNKANTEFLKLQGRYEYIQLEADPIENKIIEGRNKK
jgi:peptidoglycan hydrolase CwlO-like protein